MRVVLVGAYNRRTNYNRINAIDIKLVNDIIDEVKAKYAHVLFVISSVDKGIGKVVKERNSKYRDQNGKFEFDCLILELYHCLINDLSQSEITSHWMAQNDTLVNLGDEFFLFPEERMKGGTMFDLVNKIKAKGLPYTIYLPSGEVGAKHPDTLKDASSLPST